MVIICLSGDALVAFGYAVLVLFFSVGLCAWFWSGAEVGV